MTNKKIINSAQKIAEMLCDIKREDWLISLEDAMKTVYEKIKCDDECNDTIKHKVLSHVVNDALFSFIKKQTDLENPTYFFFAAKIDNKFCVQFNNFENEEDHTIKEALACIEYFKRTYNHKPLSIDLDIDYGFLVVVSKDLARSFLLGNTFQLIKLALEAEEVVLKQKKES